MPRARELAGLTHLTSDCVVDARLFYVVRFLSEARPRLTSELSDQVQ